MMIRLAQIFLEFKDKPTPEEERLDSIKKGYQKLDITRLEKVYGKLQRKVQSYQDSGIKVPESMLSLQKSAGAILRSKKEKKGLD